MAVCINRGGIKILILTYSHSTFKSFRLQEKGGK